MRLAKVISGGQTGVDQAALDVAIEKGLLHGHCPIGRRFPQELMGSARGGPVRDENFVHPTLAFDRIRDRRFRAFPCGLPGTRTATAGQTALPATLAATPGLGGATAGATAIAESIPEFSKLDLLLVEVAEPGGDVVYLSRHLSQEVEKDRLAIKKVFDVN